MLRMLCLLLVWSLASLASGNLPGQDRPIRGLFLGDRGGHRPADRFRDLAPELAERGIELTYSEQVADLNPDTLSKLDVVVVYANIDTLDDAPAQALVAFVEQGGGFVPLHCASYCFRNQPDVVSMIGGQFQSHGTGIFRTQIAVDQHEIMQGFDGFESWDETYVHHLHNEQDRTVLAYRIDGSGKEPWTWVRRQGKGRVFYTAWGHDARTWTHPGFQNLVERGIRWAVRRDPAMAGPYRQDGEFKTPEMQPLPEERKPFEFVDVGGKIPNYRPSGQWGDQAAPLRLMQQPLPAADSMQHVVVPRGFHVELFAAEPDLQGKPISMAWDEQGRLWVCETVDYPNELQPAGKGRDRIRICEDTDHDGRADKFTVFAEGLSIPTTLTFSRGGVIVQDGTRTVYLKDLDGDDVADERSVLLEGWSLGDTHGGVSNFRYGLDNWIWGMQGYNSSSPKSLATGASQRFRQGFFRMKPDGSDIEFIRSTDNNTWGLGFSETGVVFGSTANGCPSVYMPIANRYYESVLGWTPGLTLHSMARSNQFFPITEKVRQVDFHGGFTAAAGHALYTARQYPQEYWNRVAFVNGPTGHLVASFVLNGQGTDFRSENRFNLFASEDEWTAPIMSEVGPDGQVWIIDWYNYIVQHNPTPAGFETGKGAAYETDLRDKKYGRIYRVVADNSPASDFPNLALATPDQLVAALNHPTMEIRLQAQRLLVERGKQDVVQGLLALIQDTRVDAIGLNAGAIHAIWTLHGLGQISSNNPAILEVVKKGLQHPAAGVRRNAVQALPRDEATIRLLAAARLDRDPDFQVRLATLLAFADSEQESDEAAAALLAALSHPSVLADRWLADALTCAAARHSSRFLSQLTRSAAVGDQGDALIRVVAEHHARSDKRGNSAALLASLKDADRSLLEAVIDGFAKGWKGNPDAEVAVDPALESSLLPIFDRLGTATQGDLIQLADRWKMESLAGFAAQIADSYLEQVRDEQATTESRIAAARNLVAFRPASDEVVDSLVQVLTPQTPPEVADGVVAALQGSQATSLGQALVKRMNQVTPGIKQSILATLLGRGAATSSLLDAVESGDVALSDLAIDQRQFLAAHPDAKLRQRASALLAKGGSLASANREKVIRDFQVALEPVGDPEKGALIFKDQCAKCHVHGDVGTNIGPNLTGMSVHPRQELLTHILDPSRDVESNFRSYTVLLLDGQVASGMLASESRTTIELVDTEGKRRTLLREDIEDLVMSRKSVMPEGFESTIAPPAMTDLLAFLTRKQRFIPLSLDKVATVSSTDSLFYGIPGREDHIDFGNWDRKEFQGIPFQLVSPGEANRHNAVILRGHRGELSARMPDSVEIPCSVQARTIHFLGGVGGWSFPFERQKQVSMIVRLQYADGQTEDHSWVNGEHIADYVGFTDVPQSKLAFRLDGRQVRHLSVTPQRKTPLKSLSLVRGEDTTAPIVFAITVETDGE